MTKRLRKATSRRKDLFWFIVSEVSVHGQLVPCSGPEVRQKSMVEESCSAHDSQELRAGKERGRARTRHTPLGHAPETCPSSQAHLPPYLPPPKGISGLIHHEARAPVIHHFPHAPPLNTAALGTQPPTRVPWGHSRSNCNGSPINGSTDCRLGPFINETRRAHLQTPQQDVAYLSIYYKLPGEGLALRVGRSFYLQNL